MLVERSLVLKILCICCLYLVFSQRLTFIPPPLPLHVFPAFQIQNWFLTTLHLVTTIVDHEVGGASLIPSPLLSLSSSPHSCSSTNRRLSSSSSSSSIPLSSLSPTCPPLSSSRFRWDPITPPRPLEGLDLGLLRWGGPHLWSHRMQMQGNAPPHPRGVA